MAQIMQFPGANIWHLLNGDLTERLRDKRFNRRFSQSQSQQRLATEPGCRGTEVKLCLCDSVRRKPWNYEQILVRMNSDDRTWVEQTVHRWLNLQYVCCYVELEHVNYSVSACTRRYPTPGIPCNISQLCVDFKTANMLDNPEKSKKN